MNPMITENRTPGERAMDADPFFPSMPSRECSLTESMRLIVQRIDSGRMAIRPMVLVVPIIGRSIEIVLGMPMPYSARCDDPLVIASAKHAERYGRLARTLAKFPGVAWDDPDEAGFTLSVITRGAAELAEGIVSLRDCAAYLVAYADGLAAAGWSDGAVRR